MVLCLTVPDGTPAQIKPLLQLGTSEALPSTIADVATLTSLQPLTRELYVDAGTPVAAAEQTGAIAFPFATVQQGVNALIALGGGVLLIAPGTYPEAVAAGGVGQAIDFVNFGSAATVTITSVVLQGGPVAFFGISLGSISVGTTASVRLERSVATGNVSCLGLTMLNATVVGNVSCASFTLNNSNVNGTVNALGTMLFKDGIFGASVTSTGTGTHRLDNTRLQGTYTANGPGSTTFMRGCIANLAVSATNVDLKACTLFSLTVGANATVRFTNIGDTLTVGGGATLYQARLGNVSNVVGQLVTDFASIAGVLPVLSYGSIVLFDTAPRITLTVAVPVVAAGAVAYVNASLVATDLVGMVNASSLIIANPTADLVAAGPGGGLLNVRFSAANTVRFCFLGPLAAQPAAQFVLGFV